jgi:hypothetical protein
MASWSYDAAVARGRRDPYRRNVVDVLSPDAHQGAVIPCVTAIDDPGAEPVEGSPGRLVRHFAAAGRNRARGTAQEPRSRPAATCDPSETTAAEDGVPHRVTASVTVTGRAVPRTRTLVQLLLPYELAEPMAMDGTTASAVRDAGNGVAQGSVRLGSPPSLADQARAWVEESCARQGIPVKVRDPLVLQRVAVLLGSEPTTPPTPATRA